MEAHRHRRPGAAPVRRLLHRPRHLRVDADAEPDHRGHHLLLPVPRHLDARLDRRPGGRPGDAGRLLPRRDESHGGHGEGGPRPQGRRVLPELHRLRADPGAPLRREPAVEGLMRRLVDALAPLGLLVMIGAAAWLRAGKTLPGKPEYYTIAGFVLIGLHVLLRWDDIVGLIGRRQAKYGANTLVVAVAAAAILGGVNYFVNRHTKRWDLTKNQRYSLSDQTKKVLANLKDDVKITYFDRAANLSAGEDRLKEYRAASTRIKTEFVDPLKDPTRAENYDAKGPWPSIVVERASNREKIGNDSEQDITNAIIKVTHDKKKTICFEEGEGERDLEDGGDAGLSAAKAALGKSQYETQK